MSGTAELLCRLPLTTRTTVKAYAYLWCDDIDDLDDKDWDIEEFERTFVL